MIDVQSVAEAARNATNLAKGIETGGMAVAFGLVVQAGVRIVGMVLDYKRKSKPDNPGNQESNSKMDLACSAITRVEAYCKDGHDDHLGQISTLNVVKDEALKQTKFLSSVSNKLSILVAYERARNGVRVPEDED